MPLTIRLEAKQGRECGGCNACCKLLPMKEFDKPANKRCQHQRLSRGCAIYSRRPMACQMWSCRWLTGDGTEGMRRPDRAHYVIDPIPDYVTARNNITGEGINYPCIQVWCDPDYPDAWRDPDLRRFIEAQAAEGWMTLVRLANVEAVLIAAPCLSEDRKWHEVRTRCNTKEHSLLDFVAAFSGEGAQP